MVHLDWLAAISNSALPPGITESAVLVAAARARASRLTPHASGDKLAATLVNAVGIDAYRRFADDAITAVEVGSEAFAQLQSLTDRMAVRTAFYDAAVLGQFTQATDQVVVLGAGFDTRAHRLPWERGVVVYEIDQPATLSFKRWVLADQAKPDLASAIDVPADLTQNWIQPLLEAGFDHRRPTIWVAEGVLSYLSESAKRLLVAGLTSITVAGSTFCCDASLTRGCCETEQPPPTWDVTVANHELVMSTAIQDEGSQQPIEEMLSIAGWQTETYSIDKLCRRFNLAAPQSVLSAGYLVASNPLRGA